MPRILVTGGCGYIGSHTIVDLIHSGYEVICLDNLSNSSEDVLKGISEITGVTMINHQIDLTNRDELIKFFQSESPIDGIVHFAALKAVGESMIHPAKYFYNNVIGMTNLLDLAVKHDVSHFVFSSSCTVYGDPETLPVDETSPILPASSPYGRTKQIGEMMLEDICHLTPLKGISLRYFNPAGAHPSALIGESPSNPPLNLVPIITESAYGVRPEIKVFGTDYDTRDGTCIRDYIHVCDLARAHTLALDFIAANPDVNLEVFNLGTGNGTSVLEAIQAFESATGEKVPYSLADRRSGDVPAIFSNNEKALNVLGWKPTHNMEFIMKTAWMWEKQRQQS